MRITFPDHMTIDNWVGALSIDVPKENIPQLKAFPSWQAWARYTVGLPTFANQRVPPPTENETWQQWARKLIQVMFF